MSKEAELHLLSCCFQKPEIVKNLDLESDDFSSLEYRSLYIGLETLRDADRLDLADLMDFYQKQGRIKDYIDIANSVINPDHYAQYAKVIRRDSNSGKLERACLEGAEIARSHGDFDTKLEDVLTLYDGFKSEGSKTILTADQLATDYMDHLEHLMDVQGLDGLSTGLDLLDKRLQGLKNGELYILAGRPGSGKSTLAMNIANHIAKELPAIFFSMEMPSKQVTQRSVASLGGVEMNWLKGGLRNDDSQWTAANHGMDLFRSSKLIVDDNSSQTIQSISIACKKHKSLRFVVVDYLQLMDGKGNTRAEEIDNISRGLKKLAKDLECPVMALSQLNRGVENRSNRRPLMSDLKESSGIEQNADVVQLIYRDEYYYPDCPTNKGYAEINTAKFRDGEVGTDILATELNKSRFKDVVNFNYQPYEEKQSKGGFSG